jgi:ribosomal protein S18 acetylase RimI-like enzyme
MRPPAIYVGAIKSGGEFHARPQIYRRLRTVLRGHDGRRGYLHHLAVDTAFPRKGVASVLVDAALQALRLQNIDKTHVMVQAGNEDAVLFWRSRDFKERGDIILMSHTAQGLTNS